jgi:hypothetical protein
LNSKKLTHTFIGDGVVSSRMNLALSEIPKPHFLLKIRAFIIIVAIVITIYKLRGKNNHKYLNLF